MSPRFTKKLAFIAGLSAAAGVPLLGACNRTASPTTSPTTLATTTSQTPTATPHSPPTTALPTTVGTLDPPQPIAQIAVSDDSGCGIPVSCDAGVRGQTCAVVGTLCVDPTQSFQLYCRQGGDYCYRWQPVAQRGPLPPPELA